MTRQARRLRAPCVRQYAGRNNVMISKWETGSVPIVSQTEINPMKTALSLILALATGGSPSRRPCRSRRGRAARTRTAIFPQAHSACRRRALRTPSPSRRTVAARGDGLRRARIACEMAARGLSLRARFVFSVEGHHRGPRGQPPRRLYLGAPEPGDEQEGAWPREQPDDVGTKATAAADLPGRLNTVHNSRTS